MGMPMYKKHPAAVPDVKVVVDSSSDSDIPIVAKFKAAQSARAAAKTATVKKATATVVEEYECSNDEFCLCQKCSL